MPIVPQITTLALILIFSITASNCSPPTLSKKQSIPCGAIFFNSDEIIFYSNINELSDKIKYFSNHDKQRKQIARNGKKKYFKLFNEKRITEYFIKISTGQNSSLF